MSNFDSKENWGGKKIFSNVDHFYDIVDRLAEIM